MVNAGRILIMPRGDWNNLDTYDMLDLVTYNGVAYLARQQSVGINPATDTSLTYWQPFGSASSIATTSTPGLVMPDGTTITVDANGLIEVPIDGVSITVNSSGKLVADVNKALGDLTNVTLTTPSTGQFLRKSASDWVNQDVYGSDILTAAGGTTINAAINAKENNHTYLTSTLAAGATSMTFTNAAIGNNSLIKVYTDVDGVNPLTRAQSGTTVTLTFDPQSVAVGVVLEVINRS